jgi:hypothetical protein
MNCTQMRAHTPLETLAHITYLFLHFFFLDLGAVKRLLSGFGRGRSASVCKVCMRFSTVLLQRIILTPSLQLNGNHCPAAACHIYHVQPKDHV